MSVIAEVLNHLYKSDLRATFSPSSLTVGLTASIVARQNPNRLWLGFINLSASDIFVSPIEQVTTTYGLLVPNSGGTLIFSVQNDFILPSLQWSAISTAAASDFMIIEQTGSIPEETPEV